MNLILTTQCNNNCDYCFQKKVKNTKYDFLKIENLELILKWLQLQPTENIIVLGGEPTLVENLKDYIFKIREYYPYNNIIIASNLLGKDNNIYFLLNLVKNNDINLLINSTYDDSNKEKFLKNLSLFELDIQKIGFSITFTNNKKLNYKYINNLFDLFQKYPLVNNIRVGFKTPIVGEQIQKIYNYDEDYLLFYSLFKDKQINYDCIPPNCQLSSKIKDDDKYGFPKINSCNECMPIDILPDFSSRFCFSSDKEFQIESIFQFNNFYDLKRFYNISDQKYQIKNSMCLNCQDYISNKCLPCHAFDELILYNKF